ncbi:MAG: hypothetical protein GXX93_07540 [Anaerolineae bacterium]|nr:hypothetical protein [Anaerolineae bacterium]
MTAQWVDVGVECRSEVAYAEQPRVIVWPEGERAPVSAVVAAWITPSGPGFRVEAGGRPIEVRYLEAEDRWQARPLHRGPSPRLAHRGVRD